MARVYASNSIWTSGANPYICAESEANASYIWAYFKAKGWSDSAIAGLVGNTTHESYNNPGFHERGGSGFGIVQWTPSSNYINWARPRGFPVDSNYSDPEKYLVGQCERIMYELNTGIEFYPNSRYDRNWTSYRDWNSYIQNTLSPEDAAWLFMSNYERPNYNAAMNSLQDRRGYARRWYDMFVNSHSSGSASQTTAAHAAAQWAVGIANDASHGYDQINRWGERGDYDCSSLVITAYDTVKPELALKASGATYTGNMRSVFLAKGFQDVTSQINLQTGSGLIEGDVLLNTVHHTAMAIGDGQIVQASISENGTTTGRPGDQTGNEITVKPYYNFPWNYVLRYDGMTTFGGVGSSGAVSIVRAIPITKTSWADDPERNG